MKDIEIQQLTSDALPLVAAFIHRWRDAALDAPSSRQSSKYDAMSIERRLRWLLAENPVESLEWRLGYSLVDRAGAIRGLNLTFPAAFLSAERRVLALCASSFFVEPSARSLGFYLFRKYLASQKYSFFLATTCNRQSGDLWNMLGGHAVQGSDLEYCIPLRLDVVASALMAGKTMNRGLLKSARLCGKLVNPYMRHIMSHAPKVMIEPSHDWEKLSDLSLRHSSAKYLTTDRSVKFLQWRYGAGSPLYPCDIYTFRDKQGNEGWFSLGRVIRGTEGQIRGTLLLNAIWPRDKMSFKSILYAILRVAPEDTDAIFCRPQPGTTCRDYCHWAIPRRLQSPRSFVISRDSEFVTLSDSLDYDDSDDGAWTAQWGRCPDTSNSAVRQPYLKSCRY